ncbi:acyltransferase [Saccharopolyspora cebuensis]|uniref:Acyltransferase n=1 Tax=Saccharopolyspora cebuensis TaxID=418759 RepID=A0ABV4CGY0_9PSEU
MVVLSPSPSAPARAESRDPVLDLVRAACLVVVVVLHAMMAGIEVVDGRIRIGNAFAGQEWFAVVTWFVQVMPVFFVVGGFAGLTQWRGMRARGATAGEYARARLHRLARPAAVAFAAIAVGLLTAAALGTPPDVLAEVGFRLAQPMWFIAVYLGVSALVPVLARAHGAAPRRTLLALVAAALGVDALALGTGIPAVGFLNLAFVWMALQQLGFWYADGWFRSRSRGELLGGAAGALALLLVVTVLGPYPADMLANLNPPTSCLVLLGLVQVCGLALVEPRLAARMRHPDLRRLVDGIGGRSLTVYLWHMPALVLFAVVLLAVDARWPEPLGWPWWTSRGWWLAGVVVLLVPIARRLGRLERRPVPGGPVPAPVVAFGVVLATAGSVAVLVVGFTPLTAVLGSALLAASVRITTRELRPTPTRR